MVDFSNFILEHEHDDTSRLLLSKDRWPDIDISLAVNTIESRKKIRTKLPSWYVCPGLIFPRKLSAEQCSSEETAMLKASIAYRLLTLAGSQESGDPEETKESRGSKPKPLIADVTGGLGADDWAFCKAGFRVHYNEMDPALCEAAEANFRTLGCTDITISNRMVTPDDTPDTILSMTGGRRPDMIFADPARRDSAGKKVFLLEDCSPDILQLKDMLLETSPLLMVKLSPMADITMVRTRLGDRCREIHIIASKGECRELLAVLQRDWAGSTEYYAWEGPSDPFVSTSEEKENAKARIYDPQTSLYHPQTRLYEPQARRLSEDRTDIMSESRLLFEPGKALLKAGAFDLIAQREELTKLSRSTHLYLIENSPTGMASLQRLLHLGKLFCIAAVYPLSKAGIREAAATYGRTDVTARNIPMTSEELKARLDKEARNRKGAGLQGKSGTSRQEESPAASAAEGFHIFGVKCGDGRQAENMLIVAYPYNTSL
ncbi:MAG: hypothetical protein IAC08_05300 [Bacteroidetes bacterium]|uniref:PG-1098 ferredoxin-like domain-containing protein n=1 Tax=Candidatus Cryptobacteroides intestinigallinarum TaxID=2840767 RepID=A0A9D9HL22_9BACT|nr:hypothetical protein [Candidatus Cryptobacteroides intestinigallinarum]